MKLHLDLPAEQLVESALGACGLHVGDVVFVNVVGSRAEGLSRTASDYDLLVVVADAVQLAPDIARRSTTLLGRALDIEVMPLTVFEDRLASDSWWPIGARHQDLLELRTRLTHGHCLFGLDAFCGVVSSWNLLAHRSAVELHFQERAKLCFDEVTDALANGACERSALCARTLLEHVVEALLARHGDLYLRPKWRLERIDRTLPEVVSAEDRQALKMHLLGASIAESPDLRTWTRAIVRFCRRLQATHHFNPVVLDRLGRLAVGLRATERLHAVFPDARGGLAAHVWGHRISLTDQQAALLLALDRSQGGSLQCRHAQEDAQLIITEDLAALARAGLTECVAEATL